MEFQKTVVTVFISSDADMNNSWIPKIKHALAGTVVLYIRSVEWLELLQKFKKTIKYV